MQPLPLRRWSLPAARLRRYPDARRLGGLASRRGQWPDVGTARHLRQLPQPTGGDAVQEGGVVAKPFVTGQPARAELATGHDRLHHLGRQRRLGGERRVLGNSRRLPALLEGGTKPRLWQIEASVQQRVTALAGVAHEHPRLTIGPLAQRPAPLAGHPRRVRALLGHITAVHRQHALRLAVGLLDQAPMAPQHRRIIPGRFAQEVLHRPHLPVGPFPRPQQPQRHCFDVLAWHIRHQQPPQLDLGPLALRRIVEARREGCMIRRKGVGDPLQTGGLDRHYPWLRGHQVHHHRFVRGHHGWAPFALVHRSLQPTTSPLSALVVILVHCGRLPLALRIVGAQLRARTNRSLEDAAAALSTERTRLRRLHLDNLDVRASFMISYRDLSTNEQRLFRSLGLMSTSYFSLQAISRLLDAPSSIVEEGLERLIQAQLANEPVVPGWYSMHDLLHAFAQEKAHEEDSDSDRQQAILRVAQYFCAASVAFTAMLHAEGRRSRAEEIAADTGEPVPTIEKELTATAYQWLDLEQRNILAAVDTAYATKQWDLTMGFAATFAYYLNSRGEWGTERLLLERGLEAARALSNRRGEAAMLGDLGNLHQRQGRYETASDCYGAARDIFHQLDDHKGETSTLNNLGLLYMHQSLLAEALDAFELVLASYREQSDRHGEANALGNLGQVHAARGRYAEAEECLLDGLDLCRDLGDRPGQASAFLNLANVYTQQQKYGKSLIFFNASGAVFEELGDWHGAGAVLNSSGGLWWQLLAIPAAVDCFQRAQAIFHAHGDLHGEAQVLNNLGLAHSELHQSTEKEGMLPKRPVILKGRQVSTDRCRIATARVRYLSTMASSWPT